ncbi:hypothetical protein HK405_008123, partial [Cladochytrium tenue]
STSADREDDDNDDLNDDGGAWFAHATAELPAFPAPLARINRTAACAAFSGAVQADRAGQDSVSVAVAVAASRTEAAAADDSIIARDPPRRREASYAE